MEHNRWLLIREEGNVLGQSLCFRGPLADGRVSLRPLMQTWNIRKALMAKKAF